MRSISDARGASLRPVRTASRTASAPTSPTGSPRRVTTAFRAPVARSWAAASAIVLSGVSEHTGTRSPHVDGSLSICAVVAFADTGILARSFAASAGRELDASTEMKALGVANLACGLAGGFPVSASASRTPVARASGARTQVAGLVAAAAVAMTVVAAPGLTRHVPSSALAAIVIASVVRLDPTELALSVLAFGGVAVLGVLQGIAAAVGLSLVAFVAKAWRPHVAELVRLDGRKGYHDHARHPGGRQVPGLVILRFDAPLFFPNAEMFADAVRRAIAGSRSTVRWCAIAGEPITDVDTTAAEMLERLDDELAAGGIRLVFAEMKGPVKDQLRRYGLRERFVGRLGYTTLGTLVSDYVATNIVDWSDWTDEPRGVAPPAATRT
jgi:MFS superfamily sulfate permease-like transporter